MSHLPPGYSYAPGPPPVFHLHAPEPYLDPNAPYPIGSYWELVKDEIAYADPDEFKKSLGLVPHDFAPRELRRGTVVQIKGYSSRAHQTDSPAVLAKYALYTVQRVVKNVPCSLAQGPPYDLKPEHIKRKISDTVSLRGRLNKEECAYVFANMANGLTQNTPIFVYDAKISKALMNMSLIMYTVRVLKLGTYHMNYIIDRDLVHDELRACQPRQARSG